MHTLCRILLCFVVCIAVTACSPLEQNNTNQTQKLIYGLTLTVSGIDPHINRSTELGIVLRQVYDTLVYRDPETLEFVPGLARSWEISPDLLTYTFHLRDDVTFQDGTPFNAQAVATNIDRILSPELASQKARFLLGPIVSYQIVDELTFRVILGEPFEPLLDSFSQVYLGIASPTALAQYADEPLRYQYHQVGTGPFSFVEYVPEDRIVIRRNPNYAWAPDFYGELPENAVQEVEFRFFRDPATRLIALENGDADIMGELLPTDARSLTGNPDIQLLPIPIPGEPLQFYMNTTLFPTDDIRVRQALIYAVNRTTIVDIIYGGFSPVAWGPLSAQALYYNRGVQNVYAYNLQQAQELLTLAGFTDSDADGLLDRNGTVLELNILQPPWGFLPEVTQLLQDQWRSLGIRVNVQPVPGFVPLLEAVQEGTYNLVAFDAAGLDPYILNQSYLSTSNENWTNYVNADLDTLLLQAARQADTEERRLSYGRAQGIIMEQALILPIRDYVNLNAYRTRIQGLRFDPYGWFPLLYGVAIQG